MKALGSGVSVEHRLTMRSRSVRHRLGPPPHRESLHYVTRANKPRKSATCRYACDGVGGDGVRRLEPKRRWCPCCRMAEGDIVWWERFNVLTRRETGSLLDDFEVRVATSSSVSTCRQTDAGQSGPCRSASSPSSRGRGSRQRRLRPDSKKAATGMEEVRVSRIGTRPTVAPSRASRKIVQNQPDVSRSTCGSPSQS